MERGLPPVEGGVWVVKGKGCRRGRIKRTNFVKDKLTKNGNGKRTNNGTKKEGKGEKVDSVYSIHISEEAMNDL